MDLQNTNISNNTGVSWSIVVQVIVGIVSVIVTYYSSQMGVNDKINAIVLKQKATDDAQSQEIVLMNLFSRGLNIGRYGTTSSS